MLYIASGIHAGGRTCVQEDVKYHIGSDINGDIVLRDDGIDACHVTLEVSEGYVRLASHADTVLIDGFRQLPPGHIAESRLPCRFSLGDVQLCIAKDDSSAGGRAWMSCWRQMAWLPRSRTKWWLSFVIFLTALVVYTLLPGSPAVNAGGADAALAQEPPLQAAVSAQTVQRAFRNRLKEAGLPQMLVQVDGNLVSVRGALPVYQTVQWRSIQEWFDQHFGAHYLLRSEMTTMEMPNVAIAAIWLGERPYVVDAEGERHYPGSMLKEGWMLKNINEGQIVLARNGQEYVFRL